MSKRAFLARLAVMILFITNFGAVAIELIFYHVMSPTFDDMVLMIIVPGVDVVLITLVYFVIAY